MPYSNTSTTMTPAVADARAPVLALLALLLAGTYPGPVTADERDEETPDEYATDETPSLALLDYLGSWDEVDAGWLELMADARSDDDAEHGDDDHD